MYSLFLLIPGSFLGVMVLLAVVGRLFTGCRFYTRIATCYLAIIACAAYGTAAAIVLRIVGRVSVAQWTTARCMSYVGGTLTGISFEIEGEDHLLTRPAIFISNHQSELDILFLANAFPKHCSVTAKSSLKYIPFLGWFMALSGTVFIDRANRKTAIAAFDGAINRIQGSKQSVWIFPEGTRSYFEKPDLLPFKKGAFHLALQAGVPIVPVVVQNYTHVLSLKGKSFESGVVKVKVLEPIQTKGLTSEDVPRLVEETRAKMLAVIQSMGSPAKNLKSE